jgi:hypothetical protein
MNLLFTLAIPLVPIVCLWAIVRYGPVRNPWWHHERPVGFALFVGGIAFLAGFLGPMLLAPHANQGPLLGIFLTGPLGVIVGLVWGLQRAAQRRKATEDTL